MAAFEPVIALLTCSSTPALLRKREREKERLGERERERDREKVCVCVMLLQISGEEGGSGCEPGVDGGLLFDTF